jgi:rhodanese-related sulfurtransferase
MVADARAKIEEIDSEAAIALLKDPDVQFVDLRDPRERDRSGFIPGAFHCPRGMLEFWVDPESPYFKDVFAQDMGFEAAHLRDGFGGWEKAGGPVEKKGDPETL